MADEFHTDERIAGFYLASIKKALGWVGIMEDRDDVANVCEALGCGPRQAFRVLEELERRGFVTKMPKRNQWKTTDKGHRLAHQWKPPRRFRPAVERDDEDAPTNQGFDDVPGLILRSTDDDEDSFEEALLDTTFWAEYEGDHLVEVSVMQPDDYENPGGGTIELSAYLSPASARTFAASLLKAAEMADAEIARRATNPPKRSALAEEAPVPASSKGGVTREDDVVAATGGDRRAEATGKRNKKTTKIAVAATLAEVRGAKVVPSPRPKKR